VVEQLSLFPVSRLAKARLIKKERLPAVEKAFSHLPASMHEELVNHIMQGNLHPQHLAAHPLLRDSRDEATKKALNTIAKALFEAHAHWSNASIRFPESEGGQRFMEVSEKAVEQAKAMLSQLAVKLPRSRVSSQLLALVKEKYLPYYLFCMGIHARNLPQPTDLGKGKKFGVTRTAFALSKVFRKAWKDGLFPRFSARTAKWVEGKIRR